MANIPHLLLAAGDSRRMGQPKQLLRWGEKTLIEHQIQTLLKTGNPINVVLGAHSNSVIPVVKKYKVNIFINNNWENGMGSSIALGINRLSNKFPAAVGALIMLLDQPLVTADYVQRMTDTFQPGIQQIIASGYASGQTGVPALFDRFYFEELQNLTGVEGAKKIIYKHYNAVKCIEGINLTNDMDTPEDYHHLFDRFFNKS